MGKRQAKKTGILSVLLGLLISMVIYLAGVFAMAGGIVAGILPPEKTTVILPMWAMAAASCGGMVAVRRAKHRNSLLVGAVHGCSFASAIALGSFLVWNGPSKTGGSAVLLICTWLGGLLPGLFSGRRRDHRKGKRSW